MRMGFGPFESEEKRLKLVDIVDQLLGLGISSPFSQGQDALVLLAFQNKMMRECFRL